MPDFRIKPDDYTVLMAVDAKLPPGLKPFQAGAHGKFQVTGWTRPEQTLTWEIYVPQGDAYAVNVLLQPHGSQPLVVEVVGPGQTLSGAVPAAARAWRRCSLEGTLHLPAGQQQLALRAYAPDRTNGFSASVFSVELVRPAVREQLHAAARKLRANTRWLQDCRYGLMCHWTSQSFPRRGDRKPYAQAVQDFDVEGFARQAQETGAGFVVFTTSHAEHFFPAPLPSLDQILPGRTASRDLVAELAAALHRRGMELFLYYHLGASSDPAWLDATGFWETDTRRLFDNWTAMIGEIGRRYGDKLAGWWFDDGAISYYYRSAPWERLATAAKAGHAGRLVAFNPWELPSPTEFQDYWCGEGNADPSAGGALPVGGDGRFKSGSHQGLQACATLITESDWVHLRKNTDIGPARWNVAQLAGLLQAFIARKNVPIFNLEIYQEGALSPSSVETFKQARGQLNAPFHAVPIEGREGAAARPLQEVPLAHIRLLDGPFKERQEIHRRVLLDYDVNRLLHNFRVNAGLLSQAKPYGGWEAPGCGLRGHFTGHYLSACAMMFAATGDPWFKERVGQVVNGLSECQQALGDGYLSAFPVSEFEKLETRYFDGVWAPYYTIHKLMTGLLDAHEHAGNARAREIVIAMADYFAARIARLTPEAQEKMTLTNYKGNPVNEYGGIAESFLAVYQLTKDPRHLAAGRVFIRDWFLGPLARGDDRLAGLHANTHIPQARSFAAAAEVVDDPRLLPAAKFFFDQVTGWRSFAFGGNAFDEKFDAPGVESRKYDDLTGETCITHNLVQFSRALFPRTGEARYADFHEHALINHILASIAPEGQTTYHVAAQPGRFKVYGGQDNCFWCCTGSGIENTARYGQGICFTSGRKVWINQYIQSRIELPELGFTLAQQSDFPAAGTIRIRLEAAIPFDAALRFRLPPWLAGPAEARINGAAAPDPNATRDGSWLMLDRTWQPETRIELRLPMNVRVRPAMDDPGLVSFFHGPVLLAGALGREAMPESDVVVNQTAYHKLPPIEVPALKSVSPHALKAVNGRPLTYTAPTADGRQITLLPFYHLHHQRYSLYWRAAP